MKKLLILLMMLFIIPTIINGQHELPITKVMEKSRLYKTHFVNDGGDMKGVNADNYLKGLYYQAISEDMQESIKFSYLGEAAMATRESGIYSYATKLYDTSVSGNDATQTTALQQPHLSGNIAPNEHYGMCSPNGESRHVTHPEISFAADDAWSITTCLNWDGEVNSYYLNNGNGISINSCYISDVFWGIWNSLGSQLYTVIPNLSSKKHVLSIVADGSVGVIFYIDGNLIHSVSGTTSLSLSVLLKGYGTNYPFNGTVSAHVIRSQALTAEQVKAESDFLLSVYPPMPSVKIGEQEWATSNFTATITPQGTVIPEVTDDAAWAALTTPAWCYYNNDPQNGAIYGKLYNWYAVELIQQDIDLYNAANPTEHWGWHIPSQAEFTTLQAALGGSTVAGGKMKVEGFDYWNTPNTGATNSSGFSILPTGYRYITGLFSSINNNGYLWGTEYSATKGNRAYILYNATTFTINSADNMNGYSLRLIKD